MDIFGQARVAYRGDEMPRPDDDDNEEEKRQREIEDVIREATSRRPIDTEAVREAQRLRRDYLWLIRNADEMTFRKRLIDLGWEPGSPEFDERVRAWRAIRQPRGETPRDEPPAPPETSSRDAPSS